MKLNLQKLIIPRRIWGMAIAFFLLVVGFSLHRYFSFYVTTDHAIFSQVFWNSTQGNFFESSLSSVLSTNVQHDQELPQVFYHRLGQHFTPALLLWLPLYVLFPSPATLLVLQVTLITLSGLVLYVLACQHLERRPAVLITASFYGANGVIGPALGNFYDLCQLPLFMFSLMLALEKQWWGLFVLWAGATLAIREDTGVVLFSFGLYLILSQRYSRIGIAVCVASLGYIFGVTHWVMPLFSEDVSRRFTIERFGQFVEDDQASTAKILWAMLSNPMLLLQELISPVGKTIRYLLGHWLPLAFVPAIASPVWLMTALPLAQLFLQRDTEALSINMRYATAVIPGLFYGVILWWSKHPALFKPLVQKFWVACICLSLFFTFTSNPHRAWFFLLPDSFDPFIYVSPARQWQHVGEIQTLLRQIPQNASVSASRYILPHVANRRALLPFGRYSRLRFISDQQQTDKIDYIIADLWFPQQYQAAFGDARSEIRETLKHLDRVLRRGEYGIVNYRQGVLLLQRGVTSSVSAAAQWGSDRPQFQTGLQED